uniref:H15 domain-containing protein n=1 Tax=Hyaloperonospora arabidopsidis (strain Emoy2) TaxID=559515 RepID=M4B3N4_HYAAE
MPTAPSSKKIHAGPGYYDLIKEAVIMLKERSGSSRHAIDKYVASKKGSSYSKSRLNIALKRGVQSGKLVPVKGSFKLATVEKKAGVKKPVVTVSARKVLAAKPEKKSSLKKTTTKSSKKPALKKAASKLAATKRAKTSKKPVVKKSLAKKVSTKKPKTTKKKVVKKSAAKKSAPAAKK